MSIANAQILTGKVIDSVSKEPLEYVSIGVMYTGYGGLTNNEGRFKFKVKDQSVESQVRLSMIGYEAQIYSIKDIMAMEKPIMLVAKPIAINEVVVKAKGKEREIGATGFDRSRGWSGWGGMHARKGFEIGTKLELGNYLVQIKSLHVRLHKQAFDSSFYRLHIRSFKDGLVEEELLNENIIVCITEKSGWAHIDLEKYKLQFSGDVALTLEWLYVKGLNPNRAMIIDKRKHDAYILFKNKKNYVGLYRWGTEAKWKVLNKQSPSMYVKVI